MKTLFSECREADIDVAVVWPVADLGTCMRGWKGRDTMDRMRVM